MDTIAALVLFVACVVALQMRRWTWLAALNFLVLQWLFIRLARRRTLREPGGGGGQHLGWGIMLPVVPLTGWVTSYVPRASRRWLLRWGR